VDIESDAVSGAVNHGACGIWRIICGDAGLVAVGYDDFDCCGVDSIRGDTGFDCIFCGGFGCQDCCVHFGDFVGDIAVDDAAGAIAVVVGFIDVREEVDNDGLGGVEGAVTSVVAVGTGWATGDD